MSNDPEECPRSGLEELLNGINVFLILVSFLLPIVFWRHLPGRVPTHFSCADLFGAPREWGGKESVFLLPFFALLIAGVISFVSHLRNTNHIIAITDENAERQYALDRLFGAWFMLLIVTLFTYLEWMTIQIALGNAARIEPWSGVVFLCGAGIVFAVYVVNAYIAR